MPFKKLLYSVTISWAVRSSFGLLDNLSLFVSEARNWTVASSNDSSYKVPLGSPVGYYTGRSLTSISQDNKTEWYIAPRHPAERLKRIEFEHEENQYELYNMTLKNKVPVFVRAEDKKWYKIDSVPLGFRKYARNMSMYDFYDELILRPFDFKATILGNTSLN